MVILCGSILFDECMKMKYKHNVVLCLQTLECFACVLQVFFLYSNVNTYCKDTAVVFIILFCSLNMIVRMYLCVGRVLYRLYMSLLTKSFNMFEAFYTSFFDSIFYQFHMNFEEFCSRYMG